MTSPQQPTPPIPPRSTLPNTMSASNSATSGTWEGSSVTKNALGRHRAFLCVISLIGLLSTAAVLTFGLMGAYNEQENEFSKTADDLLAQFELAVKEYETAGLWIHQACSARRQERRDEHNRTVVSNMDQEEFRTLYQYVLSTGLELQAISFAMNISHEERSSIENHTRAFLQASEYQDVNYRGMVGLAPDPETGAPVLGPRSDQDFYQVIHYVEPLENIKNRAALDFDMRTSGIRWKAAQQAIRTSQPAVTSRLKLIEETQTGTAASAYSVIMMHPGMPDTFSDDVAVVVIRFPELLSRTHMASSGHLTDLKLYVFDSSHHNLDEPEFLGGLFMYGNSEDGNNTCESNCNAPLDEISLAQVREDSGRYIASRNYPIGDHEWTFVVQADDDQYRPNLTFVLLGAITILILTVCAVIWVRKSARRQTKLNALQARSEAEKAALIVKSAKMAAAAERELNDFIAHEVRNPLSAAMSAQCFVSSQTRKLEPPKDTAIWEEMHEDMNVIGSSLSFVNDLLRDMLDLHRASSNQLKIDNSHVDVLKDILEPVSAMLYQRGEMYEVIVDCPTHLIVESDRLRLKQIILNLGRNAAKFVTEGFVRLRALVVDGNVRILVEDSGPGIPESKRKVLFAKFQESLDVLNQGTGIGLSLSNKLVDLMGAEIWLDEDYHSGFGPNKGACFVIDLKRPPLAVDAIVEHDEEQPRPEAHALVKEHAASIDPELPTGLKVLVVDDAFVLRRLYKRSLSSVCPTWSMFDASDGETALKMTENDTFDIIFVDQYMASVNKTLLGTETVREMRSRGIDSAICGLSANDLEKPFRDAGADGFMIKPFPSSVDILRREVMDLLSSKDRRMGCA